MRESSRKTCFRWRYPPSNPPSQRSRSSIHPLILPLIPPLTLIPPSPLLSSLPLLPPTFPSSLSSPLSSHSFPSRCKVLEHVQEAKSYAQMFLSTLPLTSKTMKTMGSESKACYCCDSNSHEKVCIAM